MILSALKKRELIAASSHRDQQRHILLNCADMDSSVSSLCVFLLSQLRFSVGDYLPNTVLNRDRVESITIELSKHHKTYNSEKRPVMSIVPKTVRFTIY
jgi:hypothetical protein